MIRQCRRIAWSILCPAVLFLLGGCGKPAVVPARTTLDREPVEWDIVVEGELPLLKLELSDGRRANCLIDTGAALTVLSREMARQWQLRPQDLEHAPFPHVQAAHVSSLHLHGVTWRNFTVAVFPTDYLKYRGFDVILGINLFADSALTIDYLAQRARISQAPPTAMAQHIVPSRRGPGGVVEIAIDIAGQRQWVLLDTGFSGAIIIPKRLAEQLKFKGPCIDGVPLKTMYASVELFSIGRLDGPMQIGSHRIEDPIVLIRHPPQVDARLTTLPRAEQMSNAQFIIGSELLKHFVVTIDQRSGTVALQRNSERPIRMPRLATAGFFLHDLQGTITVSEVMRDSEAERAGLRPGDELLSANGVPVAELGTAGLQRLLEQRGEMNLRVRRYGQILRLRVPLTVLVE